MAPGLLGTITTHGKVCMVRQRGKEVQRPACLGRIHFGPESFDKVGPGARCVGISRLRNELRGSAPGWETRRRTSSATRTRLSERRAAVCARCQSEGLRCVHGRIQAGRYAASSTVAFPYAVRSAIRTAFNSREVGHGRSGSGLSRSTRDRYSAIEPFSKGLTRTRTSFVRLPILMPSRLRTSP